MYKWTRTYEDFDGNTRTEDFYFHLTKAEIVDWNFSVSGGMEKVIKSIMDAKDMPRLIALFKELIDRSYGEKSLDGREFVKDEALLKKFKQTNAYSDLYMELATSDDAGAAFIQGILPKDLKGSVDMNKIKAETAARFGGVPQT